MIRRKLGTFTKLSRHSIIVKVDGKEGCIVAFDPKDLHSFDHAYAVTSQRPGADKRSRFS